MSILRNEINPAARSPSLTLQDKTSRIVWLVFLGVVFGSFFHTMLSVKTYRFEIAGQFLVWGAVVACGYCLAAFFSPRLGQRKLLAVVLMSLNLYVVLNLLLMALGVEILEPKLPLSDNTSTMLSLLGITRDRVFFPLSEGINTFGIIAGASFVVAFMNMRDQSSSRWLRISAGFFGAASLVALFLVDSRLALIGAVLIPFLLTVWPAQKLRYIRFLPLFSPVFPIVLVLAIRMISASSPVNELARSSADMMTLNSRTIYWHLTWERIATFIPRHLIGYGFYGHRSSGLVADMLAVLPPVADANRLHPHNALLQYWIDTGYFGLIVFIGVFVTLIQRAEELWSRGRGRVPNACLGFILYLLTIGTTENIPTAYSRVIFAVFLLMGFLLVWPRDSKNLDQDQGLP